MKRKSIVAISLSLFMAMSLAGCGNKAETASANEGDTVIADELVTAIASSSSEDETSSEESIVEQNAEEPIGDGPIGDGAMGDSYVMDGDEYATYLNGRYICTNKKDDDLVFEFFEDGTVDTPADGSGTYYIDFDCNFSVHIGAIEGRGNYDPDTDTIDFTFGSGVYHMERDPEYNNSDVKKNVVFLEGTYYCPKDPDPRSDLHFKNDGTVDQDGMPGTYHIDSDGTISITFPVIGGSGTYNEDGSIDVTVATRQYHYVPKE